MAAESPSDTAPAKKALAARGTRVPEQIGRFRVQELLGAGAFGAVYRARDPLLNREVALKVPHARTLQSEWHRRRFLLEAKTAAQLRHSNIVPIYDAGQDGELFFIASAFIEGQTLADAIDDGHFRTAASTSDTDAFLPALRRTAKDSWHQPGVHAKARMLVAGLRRKRTAEGTDPNDVATPCVDFRRVAKLIMTLAGALDYAHRFHIVHRDVKPANIMLDRSGEPLVTDFGLARMNEIPGAQMADGVDAVDGPVSDKRPASNVPSGSPDANLTQDGMILGTPAYMAPEQARPQQDVVGPASDQYSLGAVLYELLCGEPPFSGPPGLVLSLLRNYEPPPPRSLNPHMPLDLEAICRKAMSKVAHRRYPSCSEMADDLRRWLAGEPVMARRVSVAERLARWCRRNPVVAGLSGAAALLLILVAIVASVGYATTSRALGTAETERQRAADEWERAEDARRREGAARREAEQQKEKAEQAAVSEHKSRQQADENAELADQRAKEAETQRNEAERARALERTSRLHAEASLYRLSIVLAQQRAAEGHLDRVSELLDACPVGLRHWEWGYLRRSCQAETLTLRGHTKGLRGVGFSDDGQRIATASEDATVRVWDATTGTALRVLSGHTDVVCGVAFSPNGKLVASASDDDTAKVWDLQTGQAVFTLRGHTADVNGVAFSPDGNWLATGSNDRTIKIWSLKEGTEKSILRGPTSVTEVFFSPDGSHILAGDEQGMAKVWDLNKKTVLFSVKNDGFSTNVAYSRDGQQIASAAVKRGASSRRRTPSDSASRIISSSVPSATWPPPPVPKPSSLASQPSATTGWSSARCPGRLLPARPPMPWYAWQPSRLVFQPTLRRRRFRIFRRTPPVFWGLQAIRSMSHES